MLGLDFFQKNILNSMIILLIIEISLSMMFVLHVMDKNRLSKNFVAINAPAPIEERLTGTV